MGLLRGSTDPARLFLSVLMLNVSPRLCFKPDAEGLTDPLSEHIELLWVASLVRLVLLPAAELAAAPDLSNSSCGLARGAWLDACKLCSCDRRAASSFWSSRVSSHFSSYFDASHSFSCFSLSIEFSSHSTPVDSAEKADAFDVPASFAWPLTLSQRG